MTASAMTGAATLRAMLWLLLLGAIWGLTPALAKLAMQDGVLPLGVSAVGATISAALLMAIAVARGQAPRWSRAHLWHYVAGGLVGMALANLFAFTGLTRAPAGLFALIVPLAGPLSVLLFALAGIERARPLALLGTVVSLAGIALAMAPGAALPDPALLPWAALMLLVPVCYAVANILSVKLAVPGSPHLAQAAGTLVGAAASVLVIALPLGHVGLPASIGTALVLLLHGLVTGVAYLIYFRLLVRAGGIFTSQVSYVITLAGLAYGALIFGERPGWLTLPATLLIFGGVALVTLSQRRRG